MIYRESREKRQRLVEKYVPAGEVLGRSWEGWAAHGNGEAAETVVLEEKERSSRPRESRNGTGLENGVVEDIATNSPLPRTANSTGFGHETAIAAVHCISGVIRDTAFT